MLVNSKNINGEKFFKFGLSGSHLLSKTQKKKKQIAIIAKDTRLSGYTLEPALVSGLSFRLECMFLHWDHLPTNGLGNANKDL